jgi:nucleoside-diphosphate-sugar epimerase
VLVTGATGFLGSHFVRRLLETSRYDVAVVVRPASVRARLDETAVTVVEGELRRAGALTAAASAFAPDTLVHFAWASAGPDERDRVEQVENVELTASAVVLAHAVGARRVIGLGSQAEYGPSEHPLREDDPTAPDSLYGAAKLASGAVARRLGTHLGVRVAWLRLFGAYGPGDDQRYVIPSVARALLAGRTPRLTEGRQVVDYLYVTDAADAIRAVVDDDQIDGIVNIASGQSHSVRSIAERIRDLVDPSLPLGLGALRTEAQPASWRADVGRLHSIGWRPAVELDEGLRRTVESLRSAGLPTPVAGRAPFGP